MKKFQTFLQYARNHKYWITVLSFAVIIGFVDENSLLRRYQHKYEINTLHNEIDKYQHLFEQNRKKLNELATSPEAIEEIARERYFMKAENEDVFVFEDEDGNVENVNDVNPDE